MTKIQTFLYVRPEAIANPLGEVEIEEVLVRLAQELGLERELGMRPAASSSVIVPGVEPHDVWAAIDRLLPIWKQARLFFLPRLNFARD